MSQGWVQSNTINESAGGERLLVYKLPAAAVAASCAGQALGYRMPEAAAAWRALVTAAWYSCAAR